MDMATRVQILDEDVCIPHNADTPEKGVNPTLHPSEGRLGSLTLMPRDW